MCKHSILSKRPNAMIRFCHECGTYNLVFNNLLMNFAPEGLEGFKENLEACYQANCNKCCFQDRELKDITFNTRLEGLQFLFSIAEVGDLLAMIQEAELNELVL